MMASRGDHAAAEQEFRGILPHLRRKLGPNHPDTLATQFSIAREMSARGDHAGAQEEFRNVLPQLEQTLGRDHPVTLIARFNIAREMAARGDHAAAEQEFHGIMPHLRRKLGSDHPDTLAAAEWIEALAKGECLDVWATRCRSEIIAIAVEIQRPIRTYSKVSVADDSMRHRLPQIGRTERVRLSKRCLIRGVSVMRRG